MGSLFSKPKAAKPPPLKPAPAIPTVDPNFEGEMASKIRRRSGFSKTILTGNLSPEDTGKKKLLGG